MHLGINKKSLTFFKFCDVSLKKGLSFFEKGKGLFLVAEWDYSKEKMEGVQPSINYFIINKYYQNLA